MVQLGGGELKASRSKTVISAALWGTLTPSGRCGNGDLNGGAGALEISARDIVISLVFMRKILVSSFYPRTVILT
jgi:hypothetical protein